MTIDERTQTAAPAPRPQLGAAPAISTAASAVALAEPSSSPPPAARPRKNDDYAELRAIIKRRGLLDGQLGYFTFKVFLTLGLLAIGIASMVLLRNTWLQLINAVYLAFVFTQLGLVGHDVGHRQVLRAGWKTDVLGLIFGNLLIGISREWWVDKHNRHHSHSNEPDVDPDIDIPLLAFSEEQALATRGVARFFASHQRILLFPMMTMLPFAWVEQSTSYLRGGNARQPVAEWVTYIAHYALYFALVFSLMTVEQAIAFILVHQMLFGLYMGSIFAPNHKGMPLWTSDQPPDFLRQQVLTSRNVKGGPVTDFWYGGLNYQIEHHLFPTMPRNKLREAQQVVREFCAARGVSYHETSVMQSYREILEYMHEVGAPLRASA